MSVLTLAQLLAYMTTRGTVIMRNTDGRYTLYQNAEYIREVPISLVAKAVQENAIVGRPLQHHGEYEYRRVLPKKPYRPLKRM